MPVRVETHDRLEDAARALAASRSARFLGGGTLVMRAANAGAQAFDTIIRTRDAALGGIRLEGDAVVIGAATTMSQIVAHRDTAFLAPVARVIGGPAIRNMATVGGNLFARSPYGDFTTALLALGASVITVEQSRGMPIEDFLRDRAGNMTRLVRAVSVPRPRDAGAFRFVKVARVKPKGVAVMSIAAFLPQSGSRIQGARIAYGAMAPTPIRATAAERALEGRSLDAATLDQVARVACDGIDPPTDALASAWYRREVAGVHLRRLLAGGRS
jgi:CO/xanthine dehydrogenase FAD-binding subunit